MLCLTLHFFFCLVLEAFGFRIEQPGDTSGGAELANFGFPSICLAFIHFIHSSFVGEVNCLMTLTLT